MRYKREPDEVIQRSIMASDNQITALKEMAYQLLGPNMYSVSAIIAHIADNGVIENGRLVVPAVELEKAA